MANVFKFCFARDVGVSAVKVSLFLVGVVETDTFVSGAGAWGMKEELREGVKGAEVGTIRD